MFGNSNCANAPFPPYGINDNNFGRDTFPSNYHNDNVMYMNGNFSGNPTGKFAPLSTNTMGIMNKHPYMTPIIKSYSSNDPIIDKIDHTNKNKLLHNNVANNVLDEHIVEYKINIDSLDRDVAAYPDPFSYVVKFNPPGGGTVQHEEYVDSKNRGKGTNIVSTKFSSPPTPHIRREFKNVKYVKIEHVILPQFSKTKEKSDGCYEFDTHSHLPSDRYIMLVIKELDADRIYNTSDVSTRIDENGKRYTPPIPFSMLIADKCLGNSYFTAIPYHGEKYYKNSALGNVTQLSIQFFDSSGLPLQYNNLFTKDDLESYEYENGVPFPITDLRHPFNKRIQTNLSIIIGVTECQIDTMTKFEN